MGNKIKFKEEDNTGIVGGNGLVSSTINMPVYVGGYDITGSKEVAGSIVFNFTRKPSWFHRTCTRFFLGWRWKDEEKKKSGLLLG